MAEQLTLNQLVLGSSPSRGTILLLWRTFPTLFWQEPVFRDSLKTMRLVVRFWLLLPFLLLVGGRASAQVVYDNTSGIVTNLVYKFSKEYGDEIFLAPGNRSVSEFVFQYFGDFNPTNDPGAEAVVRFYENNGPDGLPGPQTALMPGSLLWQSPAIPLLTGYNIVTLGVPLVEVPDNFTWTVRFTGLSGADGNAAGLMLADPPTIGLPLPGGRVGSYWDAWVKDDPNRDDSWSLINFGFGPTDPKASFYARVTAVPEPRTWILLGAGTAVLWRMRRNRR
jgi:hypothetical protein